MRGVVVLNFQIALTNVPFDRQYKNVLRFEDREAQETFFDVSSLFLNAKDVNFNIGSLLETTIIYTLTGSESVNDLMSKNYCIIKDKNVNATLKYYYYFIKNAIHDSGNRQIKLSVELDIFQTYYIDINFTDCEILKGHLNRFTRLKREDGGATSNTYITFDGGVNSDLYEREPIQNVSKRLSKRTKLSLNTYFTNEYYQRQEEINNWLDENVVCWVYAFFDKTHQYKFEDFSGATERLSPFSTLKSGTVIVPFASKEEQYGSFPIDIQFRVVAVPILKGTKQLYLKGTNNATAPLNIGGLQAFMSNNGDASYLAGIKISSIPPFSKYLYGDISYTNHNYSIDGSGNLTIDAKSTATTDTYRFAFANGTVYGTRYSGEANTRAIFVLDTQMPIIETTLYKSNTTDWVAYNENMVGFSKSDVIGADKNTKFNPKLLCADYKKIRVCNQNGQGFSYDLQKVNLNRFSLLVSEPLLPTITKSYIRIKQLDGIYSQYTTENMTGAVIEMDTSLTLYTDKYEEMLAQQKNFHMQNAMGIAGQILQGGLTGGISGMMSGAMSKNPTPENIQTMGGAGAGIGIATGLLRGGLSLINQGLTIDNMEQAPDSAVVGSREVLLSLMSTDFGIYIEEYECIDHEKEIVNDEMCKNGFTYNKLGNIKDFDNIRKYYNYVQAELEEMHGINISNAVHDIFVRCFANGVRFWNADAFDNNDPFSYKKENYEKWLEQ